MIQATGWSDLIQHVEDLLTRVVALEKLAGIETPAEAPEEPETLGEEQVEETQEGEN